MAPGLEYGFEKTAKNNRLFIDVPNDFFERLRDNEISASEIRILSSKKRRSIDIDEGKDRSRIYINVKKIGVLAADSARPAHIRGIIRLVEAFDRVTSDEEKDEKISISLGTSHLGDGVRYGASASILWPLSDESSVAALATSRMQEIAERLMPEPKWLVEELVYAQVSRPNGVTLQTNDMGSCSLDTDGSRYNPQDRRFELNAHNIYNHTQQLVCLAGAVAIAHADEIL